VFYGYQATFTVIICVSQKVDVLKRQSESGVKVGEGSSAFLTYLLSQTELSPDEVISNCVDIMLSAVETVQFYKLSEYLMCRLIDSMQKYTQAYRERNANHCTPHLRLNNLKSQKNTAVKILT